MNALLTVVGGVVLLAISAAAIFVLWALALCVLKWALERHDNHIWHSARSDFVNRLLRDSWWFSEDEKTMRALQLYGQAMAEDRCNISQIRDEWRRESKVGGDK